MQKIIINDVDVIIELACKALGVKQKTLDKALEIFNELKTFPVLESYKGSGAALAGGVIHTASLIENDMRSEKDIADLLKKRISTISDNFRYVVQTLGITPPIFEDEDTQT